MQIKDADTALLKTWLTKKLEKISDAESDILADYVLALVKNDDPDDEVRTNTAESLEEFLHDNTTKFVDEVIQAIKQRSFVPGYTPPKPKPTPASAATKAAQPTPPLTGAASLPHDQNGHQFAQQQQQSRKRSRSDFANPDTEWGRGGLRGNRASKRGRGGRGGYHDPDKPLLDSRQRVLEAYQQHVATHGYPYPPHPPGSFDPRQMPPMPPGILPDFDPNNPMASLAAFGKAIGLPPLPDTPYTPARFSTPSRGIPPPLDMNNAQAGFAKSPLPCGDFHQNGFCAYGNACRYQHGNSVPSSPNYDPENPTLPPTPAFHPPSFSNPSRSPFPPASSSPHYRRPRQPPSQTFSGPNYDPSVTTVIVDRIPTQSLNDDAVRSYFAKFGPIDTLSIDGPKQTATIKYATKAAATKAYTSPNAIFGNRFVKIYWQRPHHQQQDFQPQHRPHHDPFSTDFDMPDAGAEDEATEAQPTPEQIATKAAEAQRAHESKAAKLAEAAAAKEELDKRIRAQAEERKKLLAKLSSKLAPTANGSGSNGAAATANGDTTMTDTNTPTNGTATSPSKSGTQTDHLRLKLATLQAEAEFLGLPPTDDFSTSAPSLSRSPYWTQPHSGPPPNVYARGGYNPRSSSSDRRGTGATRATWSSGAAHGAVARLDNRPKAVSVALLGGGDEHGGGDLPKDIKEPGVEAALKAFLEGSAASAYTITTTTPAAAKSEQKQDAEEAKVEAGKVVVSFRERYMAEAFIQRAEAAGKAKSFGGGTCIPGLGRVELGWLRDAPTRTSATKSEDMNGAADADVDAEGGRSGGGGGGAGNVERGDDGRGTAGDGEGEMDYDNDVVEDEDECY